MEVPGAMEPMPTPAPGGEVPGAMEPMPTPAPGGEVPGAMEPMPTPAPGGGDQSAQSTQTQTTLAPEPAEPVPSPAQDPEDAGYIKGLFERVSNWLARLRDLW